MTTEPLPNIDDALGYIIDFIRSPRPSDYSSYGYEFYIPNLIETYLREMEGNTQHVSFLRDSPRMTALSPIFYEAAWELSRRGILRPSVKRFGLQATADGASGNGYSVTSAGRAWITSGNSSILLVGRMSELFGKLSGKFGDAFKQRADEAIQCHRFGNFLACCSMCGAATESILLAVAIAKSNNELQTLNLYRASGGRKKVIDAIVGKARAPIAEPFKSATSLLSFWRDEASHGTSTNISEIEAHDALARLLRFTQFSSDNWDELTAKA